MKTWLALVLAPLDALGAQSLMLVLVSPSCAGQTRLPIHLVAGAALLLALGLAGLAAAEWRGLAAGGGGSAHLQARRVMAMVATGVAVLSALVIAAMWIGAWVLWPCGQL